ncbi:MAG: zinc metallopeptidase [Clostridia bacterium]|nr:zinc metallopeptidase [Clostridia bacterium]
MIYEIIIYPLFIAAILLSLYAQIKISGTYRKYASYYTRAGRNATDVARMVLSDAGVYDVSIGRVRGNLTDHFDPRSNTLALSDTTYASYSAAAIGVAAHEAGHAIQHAEGYFPIKLRSALVPVTSFASRMSWLFIMLGVFITAFSYSSEFGYYVLLVGVALFAVTTVFQLVTLPCEFNASHRAIRALKQSGLYSSDELSAAKKVLSAAALTYVAATFASAVQLLRLVLILGRRNNRR